MAMSLLSISPSETIEFSQAPGQAPPKSKLVLTNTQSSPVAFKVKTTKPKSYLVRPSSGTLKPSDTQEVQIILQVGVDADDPQKADRFLVQAVKVDSSSTTLTKEDWGSVSGIQEMRLNVSLGVNHTSVGGKEPAAGPEKTSGGAEETPGDLKQKYDELVDYVKSLQKEKKVLEDKIKNADARPAHAKEGYSMVHLVIVAILAYLLAYVAKLLG